MIRHQADKLSLYPFRIFISNWSMYPLPATQSVVTSLPTNPICSSIGVSFINATQLPLNFTKKYTWKNHR